ncbi:hypothetical protein AYO45_04340 [Gammaproteobacteria bacterium SCGC AG-212-F23]|nr:hypothetical protein AYO45_04340 [Gammaproteobacteria bacterium SCGC AG-212-F23]
MRASPIFQENGLLSQAISGFTPRIPQQTMAEVIEKTIAANAQLVVEAGTGTGKTFSYLVPVFLSGKKAIISTGTKNLQDQLFFKDIPVIQNILQYIGKVMLLKGRANYLCRYRLKMNREDGRFVSRQLIDHLEKIYDWSASTQSGDIAELTMIPEDSGIWPHVTSHADNCLNQECDFYKDCFVVKARQQALAADVVVVNHHLFFADMALQDEGFGELLPGAEIIIFDEAHHLPEIASLFFSTTLTSRQLIEVARDSEIESLLDARDMGEISVVAKELEKSVHRMREAFGSETRRAPWPLQLPIALAGAIESVKENLQNLDSLLKVAAVRSKGLENCARRISELMGQFITLTEDVLANHIHWYETHTHSFALQLTPMVVADYFKEFMQQEKKRSWIFTSATLTVKNNFQLFTDTLGLKNALTLLLKSPFDYQKQALLYVPRGLPDVRHADYLPAFIEASLAVIAIARGKTFLLFTSHKAMEQAYLLIKDRLSFPLLLQGTAPKRELIEQFKQLGNAVLLGTSSFWYGVDVRGDALSCVIIDKLPFSSPDDPILQARIQLLRQKGVDPFSYYQLPHAVLTLKQGVGRLIRDNEDKGILMIGDPRLVGARYGETFLQSLPDMPRTRDLDNVRRFFHPIAEVSDETISA